MSAAIEIPTRVALAERLLDTRATVRMDAGTVQAGTDAGMVRGTSCRYSVPVDRGFGLWLELVPGCFAAALRDVARVKILWQHDDDEPIGLIRALTDSEEKLDYEGWITDSADVPTGRKALSLVGDRIVTQVSIGFDIQKYERIEDIEADKVTYRVIKGVLREHSPVTWGAFGDDADIERFALGESAAPVRSEASRLRARMARWR